MQSISLNSKNLIAVADLAASVLKKGGLIIYPTETVYGVGVDALNQEAVDKLLRYKSRREGKPLSIAVCDQKMAHQYADINSQAQQIYDQFLPGPVTVVSMIHQSKDPTDQDHKLAHQKNHNLKLAQGVASEFNTVGIRIPDHQLIQEIVKKLQRPVSATSANASGKKRPYSVKDVLDHLSQKQKELIDLIIDAGELPKNEPSVVIDTTLSTPLIVRQRKNQSFDPNSKNLSSAKINYLQDENCDDAKRNYLKNKNFNNAKKVELISKNVDDTREIAGKIMLKNWDKVAKMPIVIGLSADMGSGKTVFAKAVANFLQIKENVQSPTYQYLQEYNYQRHQTRGKFCHLDVWKINDVATAKKLEIENYLLPNNVLVIEWVEQIDTYLEKLLKKNQAFYLFVEIDDCSHEHYKDLQVDDDKTKTLQTESENLRIIRFEEK